MKKLVILGAGTAGTMVANRLTKLLNLDEWKITLVDQDPIHYYQAGYIYIPFGIHTKKDVIKPKRNFIPPQAQLIQSTIELVEPSHNRVRLENGLTLEYDYLIIATGTDIRPDETPGLAEHEWGKSIHSFYTLDSTSALTDKLRTFDEGRLVLNIVDTPIKCPVAPLEFVMLADWHFRERGIRDRIELVYSTPLSGAFTRPIASNILGDMLEKRNIKVESDFYIERVDPDQKKIISYDERELEYDLLVSIPLNKGADVIARSGLGDDLNYVPVNKHTFLADGYDNIFVLGDATNVPTSKAGSVAHYSIDLFGENFMRHIAGLEMKQSFDGHSNCFVESGYGKALLIDFNYETEPLPGRYPLPGIGPMALLGETEMNHWAKMMFRWMYWNILLRGSEVPLPATMSMAGKWAV